MTTKKWIIGTAVLGMLITGSAGVYAGTQIEEIKAKLNMKRSIYIDQVEFLAKDGKGNRLYPITYNGLTYLPTRAISQALDVPIKYDDVYDRVLIGIGAEEIERPKFLPLDYPLPADTKRIELVEKQGSVVFVFETKESLSSLAKKYNDYLKKKGYDQIVDSSSASELDLIGKNGVESSAISGAVLDAKKGTYKIEIVWSK